MPYFYRDVACPCGSGSQLISCHAAADVSENYQARIEHFVKNEISFRQSELDTTKIFQQAEYRTKIADFDEYLKAQQSFNSLAIRSGETWHKPIQVGLGEEEAIEADVPPPFLAHVASDLDLSESGIFMSTGLYLARPALWQRNDQGKLEAMIDFRASSRASIILNGERASKLEINILGFWECVRVGLMAVRSSVIYSFEVCRHSASE